MGDSTLVSPIVIDECGLPSSSSITPRSFNKRGDTTPSVAPTISRVACLSQSYSAMGISVQTKSLLLTAWRKQTSSSYESAWRQWCSWCDKQQLNPLHATIQLVVNFLAYHFQAGKEYRTINVYRSALSTTLPKLDGFSIGQHPLVCETMKGIFQKKPPLPRYCSSWDISIALEYIKSLVDNEVLTIKQLSAKLALLFALTSTERGCELVAHDLRFKKNNIQKGWSFI